MTKHFRFFIMLLCLAGCKPSTKFKSQYLDSNDADSLIIGYNMIKDISDSATIKKMFEHPYDRRIGSSLWYNGSNVYEAKMNALKKMSGMNPPHSITRTVDTANVMFYRDWAWKKGFIK